MLFYTHWNRGKKKTSQMECPICLRQTEIVEITYWKGYTLYQCRNCDIQFWNPMRNLGARWYEASLETRSTLSTPDKLNWYHFQFLRDRPVPRGRLLDVGCGTGVFLYEVSKYGYKVTGVDFNRKLINYGRNTFSLSDLYPMSFQEFIEHNPKAKFDVITCFEVLEHIDNPVEFVKSVKNLTRYIVLSVPNRAIPFKNLYQAKGDYPPKHLTRWNVKVLKNFLNNNGLIVEKIMVDGNKKDISKVFIKFLGKKFLPWVYNVYKKEMLTADTHIDEHRKKCNIEVLAEIFAVPLTILLQPLKIGPNIYCVAEVK